MLKARRSGKFFYGYIILAAVWIIYFSNLGLTIYGTAALNAVMAEERGFDAAAIGFAVGLCTLMQGLTGPFVGNLIDKKGVRLPFILGSILIITGSLAIAYLGLGEIPFIGAYGLVMGAGMGFAGILTTQSAVNEWFSQRKNMALAVLLSAGGIGGFISPILLNRIVDAGSWTQGWIFIAGAAAVSIAISVFVIVDRPSSIGECSDGKEYHRRHPGAAEASPSAPRLTMQQIFSQPSLYHILFNTLGRSMLYYACIGQIVLYLVYGGIPRDQAVVVISIVTVVSLLGRFAFGFICGKTIKPKHGLSFGSLFLAAGLLMITAMTGNLPLIYIGGALVGLGQGVGYIATTLTIVEYMGNTNFPRVMGISSPINYFAGALGPIASGIAATVTGSYIPVFVTLSIVCAAGGITILFSKPLDFSKFTEVPERA
ncbi:CynX/NimT family MFS transporter [Papillibacter cinnamivorans]|nr:MFS transporter [Papillibacter cinnamivorans]